MCRMGSLIVNLGRLEHMIVQVSEVAHVGDR